MLYKRLAALALGLFAALLISVEPGFAGPKSCLTGTDPSVVVDAEALRELRAAVDLACPCAGFDGSDGKTRKDYAYCTKGAIAAAAATVNLRTQCLGLAKKMLSTSTCGTNPVVDATPCIERKLKSGKLACRIRARTKKDGVTPTGLCVSSEKVARDECAKFTHCVDAADINDDLLLRAPGDGGYCRMDCDAQLTLDLQRCTALQSACDQHCSETFDLLSCHEGCAYGLGICQDMANEAGESCQANPGQGCDAVRTASLARCSATDFDASCQYTHYFDIFCAEAVVTWFGDTCASGAGDAWSQCRGLE
jgi:hypothetical protein